MRAVAAAAPQRPTLRYARWWWAGGWLIAAGVVIGSLLPGSGVPDLGVSDKVQHVLAYVLLTLWFAGLLPRSRYGVMGLALVGFGVFIEFAQHFLQYDREGDLYDVLANVLGVSCGLALAYRGLSGWMQRIERYFAGS
jgi:hypothetical protein